MVRIRMFGPKHWVVDDGIDANGRLVFSVKTAGKVEASTEGRWLIFRDAYLSFIGNHAIIYPNPTPITKALIEKPALGVEIDGA